MLGPNHMGLIPRAVFYAEQGLDIVNEKIFRTGRVGLWKQMSSTGSKPGLGPQARSPL